MISCVAGVLLQGLLVGHDEGGEELLVLAHHHHLVDVFAFQDRVLDGHRLHVLPAQEHDGLLGPAEDADLSLVGHHPQVTRVQPAVRREHFRGLVGPLVVALHHVRTLEVDDPLAARGRPPLPVSGSRSLICCSASSGPMVPGTGWCWSRTDTTGVVSVRP